MSSMGAILEPLSSDSRLIRPKSCLIGRSFFHLYGVEDTDSSRAEGDTGRMLMELLREFCVEAATFSFGQCIVSPSLCPTLSENVAKGMVGALEAQ